ncbi:hypothetical protein GJU40_00720 [Bacillus lacus]|uniref:Group-specific protein n=1 Tax=Metabacillus lacus TaxID=1983721 RepID=A0A7X2IVS8_9BACI|nr:hypothetical protein [Metabacillus lacus]MRX70691.1 hypothetical protein [Metabacillus lacus]
MNLSHQISNDLQITEVHSQFVFPFSLQLNKHEKAAESLQQNGFEFFKLSKEEHEDKFYPDDIRVSHTHIEQYFLPHIERILFPKLYQLNSINRYSKEFKEPVTLMTNKNRNLIYELTLDSIDLLLCPFEVGFITLKTSMKVQDHKLIHALDFLDHFRVLEPKVAEEKGIELQYCGKTFETLQDFIFGELCPFIVPYMLKDRHSSPYFGSLPYFIDERMYTINYIKVPKDTIVENSHLFRIGQINGFDKEGRLLIAANNPHYIKKYVEKHLYERWAPYTHYIISDHTFTCLSQDAERSSLLVSEMYGQHYYKLILHLFYKVVLLKLSFEYSKLYIEKKRTDIEPLISSITNFSAKYFFYEISSKTEGHEIARMLAHTFNIQPIYEEVKKTLQSLYQNQRNLGDQKNNNLLFILTIYTVISGIYGMNLVIEEWSGNINWRNVLTYSIFEYIALIVAISGIVVSGILGITALTKMYKEKVKNKFKGFE